MTQEDSPKRRTPPTPFRVAALRALQAALAALDGGVLDQPTRDRVITVATRAAETELRRAHFQREDRRGQTRGVT
jgi:hypothetical protein